MVNIPQDSCSKVAHDLRNAACAIAIHARLLERELAEQEINSASAAAIIKAVRRMEAALHQCRPPAP